MPSFPSTASGWVVRLRSRRLSHEEQHHLNNWLAGDERRRRELEEAQATWQLATQLRTDPAARAHLLHDAERTFQFRRWLRTTPFGSTAVISRLAAAAAAVVLVFSSREVTQIPQLENYGHAETTIGRIESYALPDSSEIMLAADSEMTVAFSQSIRETTLNRGEVFFDVRHENDRPFLIKAGSHQVLVTGTKFNVDYDATLDAIEVAVVEGAVNVGLQPGSLSRPGVEKVAAGQVILFTASGEIVVRNIKATQASAWRSHILYFDRTSLREVLREVNRYAPKPLVFTATDLEPLTLTGEFDAGDIAGVLFSLREIHEIDAFESTDHWALSRQPRR